MFGLGFHHTAYLALLIALLPLVAGIWYLSVRGAILARHAYAEELLLRRSSRPLSLRAQLPALALWLVAVMLLVVSLAGPTLNQAPQTAQAGSLEVVVLWDASHSMGAEDYKESIPPEKRAEYFGGHGNRLDMAKYIVETQIMPAITGNKLAFETYKGRGFNQAPLTADYEPLRWVLRNWVRLGQAPCCGSDYGQGLQGGVDTFTSSDPKAQKVIVLFSDGGFTGDEQQLADVVQELKKQNIRLLVLGLGTRHPVKIPEYDPVTGKFSGYFQVEGQDAYTQIDESTLRALATASGGKYEHVGAAGISDINWPEALTGPGKIEQTKADMYKVPLALSALTIFALSALCLIQNRQETLAFIRSCKARDLRENLDLFKKAVLGRYRHGSR